MSDQSFYQDDPTDPMRPAQQPSRPEGQQDKLILGSFKDSEKRQNRRPYQYPQQPQRAPSRSEPEKPPASYPHRNLGFPGNQINQQQQPGGPNPQAYPQQRQSMPSRQQAGNVGRQMPPVVDPNARPSPYSQPGQVAGRPGNAMPRPRRKRRLGRRGGCLAGCLVVLALLCIVGGLAIIPLQKVLAFGSAISTQAPISSQTGYMNTSDRVNVLVMGYGGGNHDGANLTDSMVVMSLLPPSHHTTLVSVPRDLWVQVPSGSGNYQKINAVYEVGSNNGANVVAGGDAAAKKVSDVTGLDVKYWLTINFQGFRELIDSIGGIDVYVPDSFTANYPKNDDPNVDASWIKVQFKKGMQHMDGETAIRYARARYVLDNLAEGSDFARSARQQIIMKAALAKVKQTSTWPHMFNALAALQRTIYTNLSLADLMQFALKMDLDHAHRVGLSNQNVLVDATAPNGGYILLPANGNWQGIVDYVKQQLYN